MKKSLLLYLFILTLLFNVFTYMYYSKEVTFQKAQYEKLNKKMTDSITSLNAKLADANYFSLERDEDAQNYFDSANPDQIIQYDKFIPYVIDKLKDFNDNPNGNPYTGQDKLGANKFIINKAKVVNHRWIVADYNDGEYWGEVLLKYFINKDESVSFEVIQTIIYQKQ